MIIRTANGSLMKVTEAEGQRMMDEHPFDYYYEPDGCEICVKDSWTTCDVQIGTQEPMDTIRMCHSCYIAKGGSEEGWDEVVHAEIKRIEASKKNKVILVGAGVNNLDPDVLKKLVEAGADVEAITAIDSLSALEETPKKFKAPDMEEIMINVKSKERSRKKQLNKMGRDQFKKKNRRRF